MISDNEPDFDRIADVCLARVYEVRNKGLIAEHSVVVEQLRQVWHARGDQKPSIFVGGTLLFNKGKLIPDAPSSGTMEERAAGLMEEYLQTPAVGSRQRPKMCTSQATIKTVGELIDALSIYDRSARVCGVWDGCAWPVEFVHQGDDGLIAINVSGDSGGPIDQDSDAHGIR